MMTDPGFGTPDPHDIGAEQATLGAMMMSEAIAAECAQILSAGDFYRPAHSAVFAAVTRGLRAREPVDAIAVLGRLAADGELRGGLDAPYLHTLLASVPAAVNGAYYARIVREKAVTRRVLLAARRVVQIASGEDEDPHGLTERAIREFEAVREAGLGDGLTAVTVGEFLASGTDEYDWVIPGLLERGDRFVLTGYEGAGKSELFRMFAVLTAAGIHPFTFRPMPAARVLLLDCENSARQTRRKLRPLIAQARLQGCAVGDANFWLECRPEGIDLARDKDVSWLLRQVAAIGPDITFLGPLYKLAPRALNDDTDAAPVIAVLNMIRARDSAVVLEAHAGHGLGPGGKRDLRPRGSSAFLGWPEFGYGLRWSDDAPPGVRMVDVVPWRGDRDERDWPEMLAGGGRWPWRPYSRQPDDRPYPGESGYPELGG
jgi:hypothetical protein